MHRITPTIKDYAWGSYQALAELAGRAHPTSTPEAELWVGAHEAGPCQVEHEDGSIPLDELIARDHAHHLGPENVESFGERLPFLLKILAARKPLSIQVHPDADRAASAPEGTYGDTWPKPESWVPLTDCDAFIGSLPFDEAAEAIELLGVSRLTGAVGAARTATDPSHALLKAVLETPADGRPELVADVVAAVTAVLPSLDPTSERAAAWQTLLAVHDDFPGDIGVVVLLTMRYHRMRPGTCYFIDAGVLHALVRGTTIEILANSDNVVRAGLTPKRVDVEELLRVVDCAADVTPERPVDEGALWRYPSHAPHFALWEVRPGSESIPAPGQGQPRLFLSLGRETELHWRTEQLKLSSLECAWSPAADGAVLVRAGAGTRVFVATVNDTAERRRPRRR